MLYTLKNKNYEIKVDSFGAELKSSKYKNEEYLHNGDDIYWNRSSPVLFPIIGKLKSDYFEYKDKKYTLSSHGFARNKEFEIIENTSTSLSFLLKEDKETLKSYPFRFNLTIEYILKENSFSINYKVSSDEDILFSLGTHPAFLLKEDINNTYLEFNKNETSDLLCLDSSNGCISSIKKDYLKSNVLNMNSETFKDDALIFEALKSNSVTLKNRINNKSVNIIFNNFSHIGFWAPVDAPFVCIEPWCGISDYGDTNHKFEDKIGIIKLDRNKTFSRSLEVSFL